MKISPIYYQDHSQPFVSLNQAKSEWMMSDTSLFDPFLFLNMKVIKEKSTEVKKVE